LNEATSKLLDGLPVHSLQEPTTADSPTNYYKDRFPVLSALAKRYLSAPQTSVPNERVFSTVGDILTDKRSCPSTENAEKLLILKKICLNFELAATLNTVGVTSW